MVWELIGLSLLHYILIEQQLVLYNTNITAVLCSWYHGSISRIEAEKLLRVHREGSYLIRTSESNRQDYSLSVK